MDRTVKLYLSLYAVSRVGTAASSFALSYAAYDVNKSSEQFGYALGIYMLPAVISPFAGAIVDRLGIKFGFYVNNISNIFISLVFLSLISRYQVSIESIYLVSFLKGLATALGASSNTNFPSYITEGKELEKANAHIFSIRQFSVFLGLSLGGLLYAALGLRGAILVDILTTLPVVIFVYLTQITKVGISKKGIFDFSVIFKPINATFIALFFGVNFFAFAAEALGPAKMESYGLGVGGTVIYAGLIALGSMMGAQVIGLDKLSKVISSQGFIITLCLLLFLSLLPITISNTIYLDFTAALIIGLVTSIISALTISRLQSSISANDRGKLMGILVMAGSIAHPIAAFVFDLLHRSGITGAFFVGIFTMPLVISELWNRKLAYLIIKDKSND